MRKRSIIYVGGFNFYYGAVRGTAFKWLNFDRLFTLLRQDDEVKSIYYFTAKVSGPTGPNQELYLAALGTCPRVRIIFGKFKPKRVLCRVPACTYAGSRWFDSAEEKRTDVNIAIQILDDVFHKRAERFVIVSGDSDLVPALEMAKSYDPQIELIVYVPSRSPIRGAAVELRGAADKDRDFPLRLLRFAQFPADVPDGRGGFIHKPASW